MKKLLLSLAILTFASSASAAYTGPVELTAAKMTVAEALKSQDDTEAYLEGTIISKVGKKKYNFKDATGTMIVEIDDNLFRSKTVSETTNVRLIGVVDSEVDKPYTFDVEALEIME